MAEDLVEEETIPIKVEFLEEYRSQGEVYAKGDRRTFIDPERVARAKNWISLGIAKDLEGNIETGVRKTVTATLEVEG